MEEEENTKFPAITENILAMCKLDQDMRERTLDTSFTDEDVQIDRDNTTNMQIIVNSIGWPTISKVGKTA